MGRWHYYGTGSTDFPFASLVHIDAQTILDADTTKITSTPNLGTAGGNFTSPNGANTPQIRTGGQNGKRYLQYAGGSGAYHDADAALITGLGSTAQYTMFCVCTLSKPATGSFIFDGGFGAGSTDAHYSVMDTTNGIQFGRVISGTLNIPTASYSAGAIKCISGKNDAGNSILRINGLSDVTGTLSNTANTWGSFTIAALAGAHSNLLTVDLYEIIIVASALSSGDITTAETFLVNKYALT